MLMPPAKKMSALQRKTRNYTIHTTTRSFNVQLCKQPANFETREQNDLIFSNSLRPGPKLADGCRRTRWGAQSRQAKDLGRRFC